MKLCKTEGCKNNIPSYSGNNDICFSCYCKGITNESAITKKVLRKKNTTTKQDALEMGKIHNEVLLEYCERFNNSVVDSMIDYYGEHSILTNKQRTYLFLLIAKESIKKGESI